MKKIIGVLGIAVFAMAMFFNTSNAINSSNSDLDLASLITLNTADAECAITKSNGTVVASCASASSTCSLTKWGYTLTCYNARSN